MEHPGHNVTTGQPVCLLREPRRPGRRVQPGCGRDCDPRPREITSRHLVADLGVAQILEKKNCGGNGGHLPLGPQQAPEQPERKPVGLDHAGEIVGCIRIRLELGQDHLRNSHVDPGQNLGVHPNFTLVDAEELPRRPVLFDRGRDLRDHRRRAGRAGVAQLEPGQFSDETLTGAENRRRDVVHLGSGPDPTRGPKRVGQPAGSEVLETGGKRRSHARPTVVPASRSGSFSTGSSGATPSPSR